MKVSLGRFLKYINIAIAGGLVICVGLMWWFAWRPLPIRSGELTMPIGAPATVDFDEIGIPHITAESIEDAIFLQGFITAQDRMFQMDLSRRQAAGELAEVFGVVALHSDRRARQLRMRQLADQHAERLDPENRILFAAYARGVNHYLETNRNRLPVEFTLAGYEPRAWTIADSVLLGIELFRILTTSWDNEILKQQFSSMGDEEKARELFPTLTGASPPVGSNAWVLSGAKTKSGNPILANDPHLPFTAPSIWYLAHLKAEDLDVIGVTSPGLPGVILGHNQKIAWGATNLGFDVQDLYAERLDPSTGVYASKGTVRQAQRDRAWIQVKGAKPVQMDTWVTHHGPVVAAAEQLQLALRWVAAEDDGFGFPFLELNRADDWEQFRLALERFSGPAQNFVFADVEGNTGYQAAGRLPARVHDGSLPADGVSGQSEWNGYIPFEEMPSLFNPGSGLIVTANQNPFPADFPYRISGGFASPYRAARIRELLEARQDWTPEQMAEVQRDIYSAALHYLAGEAVAAYEKRGVESELVSAAVELLRDWDGEMDASESAPLVATLLFQHLRKGIADNAAPGAGANYGDEMAPQVVERLLRERPENWFDDYDPLLLRSLLDALDEGKRLQGDDVSEWKYGEYNRLALAHPVVSRLPVVGRYFRFPARRMSGSRTTVKQTTRDVGASMRAVYAPDDWDESRIVILTGQGGHALDSHQGDQWDTYWEGGSYPLQYESITAEDRLEVQPAR